MESIIHNLQLLLNTRQGSLPHLSEYGLPDRLMLYQELPESLESFSKEIETTIIKYEPRLNKVRVVMHKQDADKLSFIVRAGFQQTEIELVLSIQPDKAVNISAIEYDTCVEHQELQSYL